MPGALLAGGAARACAALPLAGGFHAGKQGGKWHLLGALFSEKSPNTL